MIRAAAPSLWNLRKDKDDNVKSKKRRKKAHRVWGTWLNRNGVGSAIFFHHKLFIEASLRLIPLIGHLPIFLRPLCGVLTKPSQNPASENSDPVPLTATLRHCNHRFFTTTAATK